MPKHVDEEWDDDSFDADDPDFDDTNGDFDDEEPTVECPYCGRSIHEDAVRCPHCEQYISNEDAPPPRKPLWIIVGTLLCLYVVYRWIVG